MTSARAYSQTSSFGTPLVDAASITKTQQQGTSSGQLGGQLGTSGLGQQQSRGMGASSMGTRRSPSYLTSMGWQPPLPQPGPTVQPQPGPAVQPPPQPATGRQPVIPQPTAVFVPIRSEQVQGMISNAPRLPSRETIKVNVSNDGAVVLRGTVGGERERRLAEAMARTAPGVGEVRNELVRVKK
jgi:hypothetical protein